MHNLLDKIQLRLKYKMFNVNRHKIFLPINFPFERVSFEGEYIHIEPDFRVLGKGKMSIGNNCIFAEKFTALTTLHQVVDDGLLPYNAENDVVGNVNVRDNVWVGANVTVFGGVTIGEGAVVGANSLVLHDVPARAVVAGVPAHTIRYRDKQSYLKQVKEQNLYLVSKYYRVGHV